ncbi:ABC transporter ATP-binding protein [Noviherbaspirillum saxi]|uniref:ABC transporter ATP-binding protein n=1 Tax=Noviherbaspirillum saxi TaxID=2320863 RepID=A0A3A3FXK8_9BURK|nr:ABC transporter ATP-binding protein [Noviherbaspirillum saxi]RJF91799.1 ABC transporter ATP-binding protein [Noviherbaspirillum saxi]
MSPVILRCEGATIRFGGLTALNDVSFELRQGHILGIIGPNGAGKSTLFNLLTGIYKPVAGKLEFMGHNLVGVTPHQIVRLGISRTFQSSRLFGDLSVLDNVLIGMHTQTTTGVMRAIFMPWRARRELTAAAERAGQLLRMVSEELYENRFSLASGLAQADRRRLEIARALAASPKLLLLDEPSAGMDDKETDALITDIRRIQQIQPTLSLIIIEHDMRLVADLPDSIMVFDFGQKIMEGSFNEIRKVERVQQAYLGKAAHA